MEIGLFQLENLVVTQSRFAFLALGETQTEDAQVAKLLTRATPVAEKDALKYLEANCIDKNFPVILVARDTKSAKRTAEELERSGYGNTYWLGL